MSGRKDWGDDDDYADNSLREAGTIQAEVSRVNGPPGTGKTTWLTKQIHRAVEVHGRHSVVVASLTRAAASEVAGRKTDIPRANVGTLHSHAYKCLNRPDIAETAEGLAKWNRYAPTPAFRISGKHAADPENAQPETVGADSVGADLYQQMGVLRARMTPREIWPNRVQRFAKSWDAFKKAENYLDFTDLIESCVRNELKLPQKPKVVMVDEAQDMSKLDMTLALQWGMAAESLVVVGDADQNLYQWRGSDPDAFYGLPATHVRTLEQSYRVPSAVHGVAQDIVRRIGEREDVTYYPRVDSAGNAVQGSAETVPYIWNRPETGLVRDIETELEDPDRTIMILASCGYMLNPLINELRQAGIPFHNPYRTTQGAWNPLRGARRLLAYMRPLPAVWGDEARMWTWKDAKSWIEVLQSKGVLAHGAKAQLERRLLADRFGDTEGDEPADLDKLALMFEEKHQIQALSIDIDWWGEYLKHPEVKRQEYALSVARRHGAARLLEKPRVVIGTIHSVKGGEADTVYVFPDMSARGWEQHRKNKDPTYRLMYVAVTRARENVRLCRPSTNMAVRW